MSKAGKRTLLAAALILLLLIAVAACFLLYEFLPVMSREDAESLLEKYPDEISFIENTYGIEMTSYFNRRAYDLIIETAADHLLENTTYDFSGLATEVCLLKVRYTRG